MSFKVVYSVAKYPKITRIALEVGTLSWHHKEDLNAIAFFEGQSGTDTKGQRDVYNKTNGFSSC